MAAVSGEPLTYNLWWYEDSSSTSSSNPTDAVIFFGFSLASGTACRHFLRSSKVPYTVALLILGIALGSLEYAGAVHLGKLGNGICSWANIDPDLLLAIFLPVLIFEGSFTMEVHQIKKCMMQMLLLAGLGVFISTFCIGSALKLTFPYSWIWKTSLLLGANLSATDPVAVVALLKELGVNVKLSTIIEGESIINDGASLVVFQLFYRMDFGQGFDWFAVLKFLTLASVGAWIPLLICTVVKYILSVYLTQVFVWFSIGIGVVFGVASIYCFRYIFNDAVIEPSLMLAVSYIAYFYNVEIIIYGDQSFVRADISWEVLYLTAVNLRAQEVAGVPGILTIVTLGMVVAASKSSFKTGQKKSLQMFWYASEIQNSFSFSQSNTHAKNFSFSPFCQRGKYAVILSSASSFSLSG
ncbi:hypothetical protein M9H77_08870 [Catharanthus roseus]|uniref:Uncharacterized protein n=1 Tax=Catharanthus roseus TaxID=4058 RepID=A0ACC0BZ40_CATRO|nr:hypothetical protein M9H77_08870 [Catharanthus roseus]